MTPTDQVASKLLEIINQVQSTVTNHGADAVNLALASVQIEGIISFILLLLPLIFMLYFSAGNLRYYFKLKATDMEKFKEKKDDIKAGIFVPLIIGMVPILIVAICSPFTLIQPFSPKLYLAHEIIQKVMQ